MKEILQYRLTKTIPWFLTAVASYQEAQAVGVVVSYQCWEYDAVRGIDRPAIKLKADREYPHRPGLSNGWTRSAAAPT